MKCVKLMKFMKFMKASKAATNTGSSEDGELTPHRERKAK